MREPEGIIEVDSEATISDLIWMSPARWAKVLEHAYLVGAEDAYIGFCRAQIIKHPKAAMAEIEAMRFHTRNEVTLRQNELKKDVDL